MAPPRARSVERAVRVSGGWAGAPALVAPGLWHHESVRLDLDLHRDAVGEDVVHGGSRPRLVDDGAQLLVGRVALDAEADSHRLVAVAHLVGDPQDPAQVDVTLERRLDLVQGHAARRSDVR